MTDVALISELSHHKMQAQKDEYPNMPYFVAPEEIPMMLRPTRRSSALNIHVLSLAVIANERKDFIDFMESLPKSATVISKKEGWKIGRTTPIKKATVLWLSARRFCAAKAGGEAKGENAEKKFWESWKILEPRWHLPSKGENANKPLLKEADISRNTVKAYLGCTRVDWQGYSEAKRKRIIKQKRSDYAR
jgi:hypothetical protein